MTHATSNDGIKGKEMSGTCYAVKLGSDKNPAKGQVIAQALCSGRNIPDAIMSLWRPGEIAIVWGYNKQLRPLSQAGLASVRTKRLKRRLEKRYPLFAEVFAEKELAARPEFFAGDRKEVLPNS